LTPTHAKKGQRRYRYYVSRGLLKGVGADGWRVAAAELEGIVVAAAGKILDNRKLLLEVAEQHNLDAIGISALLRVAQECHDQLQAATHSRDRLGEPLERVELRPESIRLTLKLCVVATRTCARPNLAQPHAVASNHWSFKFRTRASPPPNQWLERNRKIAAHVPSETPPGPPHPPKDAQNGRCLDIY
jgi:hypothetical protein